MASQQSKHDCGICYDLDIEDAFFRRELLRKVTRATKLCRVQDICNSAVNGCPGCALISEGMSVSAARTSDIVHIIFESGLPLRIESSKINIEFYVLPGEPSPGHCVGQGNHVSTSFDAELAATFAKKWLSRCKQDHALCENSQSNSRRETPPKRLLDVGSPDGSEDPRLIETDIIPPPYIALSYCWGTHGNFTTTKSTIKKRFAGMSYDELPKTFQDAVQITRRLGIRYIWIDALCIIQDDDDSMDWKIEAAKMASVYQGAILTLSATGFSSVSEGFLSPRETCQDYPIQRVGDPKSDDSTYRISCTTSTGKSMDVFVRQRLVHSAIVPEDANPEGYPLLSRGWAFQERLLSTRTLHFLPQELLWECKCDYWCECMSVAADQIWKTGVMRGSLYNKTMSDPRTANLITLWRTLVTDYSRRLLTENNDKLPALSGIARQFNNLDSSMGRYLAGLWDRDLLQNLAWQADHNYPQPRYNKRPVDMGKSKDKPLKPSWSWISTTLPVKWSTLNTKALDSSSTDSDILEVLCELDGIDKLGRVHSGRLVLKARVVSTTILQDHGGSCRLGMTGTCGPTKATLIPDTMIAALGLAVGDTIYCAQIYSYAKDQDGIWVALALRPASDPDSWKRKAGVKPPASGFYIQHGHGSELPARRGLKSLLPHFNSDQETKQKLNDRPTYRPYYKNDQVFDDEVETFFRIGLVQGTAPLLSWKPAWGAFEPKEKHLYNFSWFNGMKPRKITII